MFKGSIPALVTPMRDDGRIDFDAWDTLLDFHLREGTDGVVVGGTTGESPVLDRAALEELVRRARRRVAGRVPVIANVAAVNTPLAVQYAEHAQKLGVDGVIAMPPYIYKEGYQVVYGLVGADPCACPG